MAEATDAKLTEFTPDDRNANQGTERGRYMLETSLEKVGAGRGIVVDKHGKVIAGNKTQEVAISQGIEDAIVVETDGTRLVVTKRTDLDLDDPDPNNLARQYAYLDNRAGEVGLEWDVAQLQLDAIEGFEFGEMFLDFELSDLGVTEPDEPAEDPGAQLDKAAELQEKWGVVRGDVWVIESVATPGKFHRVMCGDSTSAEDVGRLMGGELAAMVFTDPPYNVASESRNYAADKSKSMNALKQAEWDHDFDITSVFPSLELLMAHDCAVYVCTSQWLVHRVWEWMWLWSDFCSYNVWCKPNPMPSLSKRHWTWATELIAYAVRGKHISNFPKEGHALNWWDIPKHKDTEHPTEKTVEVPSRAISFSSRPGDIVADLFLGSGTTLVACEQTGRVGFGMEIEPKYVSVTLERLAGMGLEPQRVTQ